MLWCVLMPFPVVLQATRGTPRPPAFQRAAKARAEHERLIYGLTRNWPAWYAEYTVFEQSVEELPR